MKYFQKIFPNIIKSYKFKDLPIKRPQQKNFSKKKLLKMKRNWRQMNSANSKPSNFNYWAVRNGNQNNLTQEETSFFKKFIQEKMNDDEINRQVQNQLEIDRRIKEFKKTQNLEETNQVEILEKELSLAKKEIKKLKEELEQTKEDAEKWKRKYKSYLVNSKEKSSSQVDFSSTEEEENSSNETLKKEIQELIQGTITLGKIKKLGTDKIMQICDEYEILYRNMDQASRLILKEIKN